MTRHRTKEEIKALCDEQGLWYWDQPLTNGWSFIVVASIVGDLSSGMAYYNPQTGIFFGYTPKQTYFDSSFPQSDQWYQDLKNFFHVEE